MRQKIYQWIFWGVTAFWIIVVNAIDRFGWCEVSSSTMASWVQAFGAIIAIVGGAVVMLWQQKLQMQQAAQTELEARTRTELDAVTSLGGLFFLADAKLSEARSNMSSQAAISLYFGSIYPFTHAHTLEQALKAVPLSAATQPGLILSLIEGRDSYANAIGYLGMLKNKSDPNWNAYWVEFSINADRVFGARLAFQVREQELMTP